MSVGIENGYTKIANELLEAICLLKISNYESRLLLSIIRKTYGFNKKSDRIALSQLSKITGIESQHVARTKKKLVDKNIIFQINGQIGIQKDINKWLPIGVLPKQVLPKQVLPKQVVGTTQTGSKTLPKQVDTKERKKLIQKKESKNIKNDYENEANDWLEYYKKVRQEPRRKSTKSFIKNFIFWRETYTLDEMKEAVSRAKLSKFYNEALSPDFLFRTKNRNGDCDYIGDLLNIKIQEEKII